MGLPRLIGVRLLVCTGDVGEVTCEQGGRVMRVKGVEPYHQ